MGKLIATIKANTVNIRRGPSIGAGIAGKATVGQQFEVIQVLDTPETKEQWARIEHPSIDQAYICTRMANGSVQAQVSAMPDGSNAEYIRGWNACLEAVHLNLVQMRK